MKEGWKIVKLKDICDKASSNVAQKNLVDNNGDYPIFGASGFIKNVDFYHCDKPYIGIVKDGSGVGRVCLYPAYSSLLGTLQYILPKDGYELRFVSYALQSLGLSKYSVGAAIPHIYFRDYGEHEIAVPNIFEQHRIVKILDAAFEKIDAMKANAEKNLENAKALFQQNLSEELEPKKGWVEKKLGEVCESCLGKTLNSSLDTGLQYNYLCAVNVQWDKFDLSKLKTAKFNETEREKYTVVKGDLLVCEGGETGRAAIWDSEETILYQNALHRIRFKNNEIYSRYCLFYLMNLKFGGRLDKEFSRGATIKHLVTKSLHSIPFAYPNYDIQQQIVTKLDNLSAKCKKLEEAERKTIAECDALKQAILRQVFNGEL